MVVIPEIISGCIRYLQEAVRLPDEAKNTLPVILKDGGDYYVSVGFFRGESGFVRDRPRNFYFPSIQCFYNVRTKAYSYQKIDPAAFGIKDSSKPAGNFRHLVGIGMAEFRQSMDQYNQALARLVNERIFDQTGHRSESQNALVDQIRALSAKLREPDLKSYYTHFGGQLDRLMGIR